MGKTISMTKTLALSGAEHVINRALQFDPLALQKLRALEGKVMGMQGHSPAFTLSLLLEENRIALSGFEEATSADACLCGSTFDLLRLLRSQTPATLANSGITVQGDLDLAQHFLSMTQHMDIDWEEWLSVYLGDIAAHEIGRQGRRFRHWTQKARRSMLRNVREYLLYENKTVVSAQELDAFSTEISTIIDTVNTLETRIANVRARLDAHRAPGAE
jgi:ubiquinone biosynthesis protein UbiJ